MNFDDTPAERRFRLEARAFLDAHVPAFLDEIIADAPIEERARKWQALKFEHGWACVDWPDEYGGRNVSPMESVIWGQEESRYDVPVGPYAVTMGIAAPTIAAYADDEMRGRLLSEIARGEAIWCQLFSEPGAGSDLAGLRTKAQRRGDEWIINGQKVWTTGANYSDYAVILTRSDASAPKHKGLTYFFLDMQSPGVEVRPIRQMSGESEFHEVFLTDVVVPDAQRLGAVGEGWRVAMTTLMNERLAIGEVSGADFPDALELALCADIDGEPAIEDESVQDRLADWYCQMTGVKHTRMRVLTSLSRGETPGPENSIGKIVSARKLLEIGSFGVDLVETARHVPPEMRERFVAAYLAGPGMRIAGGTDEVLRNIIAERVLGLPQEVRVDKDRPFNEVH